MQALQKSAKGKEDEGEQDDAPVKGWWATEESFTLN